MVQITALSGEALVKPDKDVYARMVEDGRSVEDFKHVLATETGFPRFQQRLLADGIGQLEDDMPSASTASIQLVISDFVLGERSQKALMHAERIVLTKSRSFFKNPRIPTGVAAAFLFAPQLWGAT